VHPCRLTDGEADEGGAIFMNAWILKILDSEIWSNLANVAGGAIYVNGSSVNVHRSDFAFNESTAEGGALYLRNFTSPYVLSTDSTFRNNIADVSGGAVVLEEGDASPRITLERTRFEGNFAGDGGALDLRGGRATLVDCELEANQTVGFGGSQSGGAIRIIGNGGGTAVVPVVTIEGTTMNSNQAETGGAILVGNGVLSMANSTLSGNDATVSGGGIFAGFLGLVQLASVTVTDNEAAPGNITMGDGGGLFINGGLVEVRDSFIAGNEARRSGTGGSVKEDADCDGTLTSEGYNLIGITEGCTVVGNTTGNITNFLIEAADLDPLFDNGGSTLTHALGASSNALDAGNPAGCAWDHDADSGTDLVMLEIQDS